MTYDDSTIAAHPQAPAAELARIVNQRPDLRAVVAANPAAQPALLDWLGSLRDPAVDAALATRAAQQAAAAPAPAAAASWAPAPLSAAGTSWSPEAAPAGSTVPPQAATQGWGQPAAQAWGQPASAAAATAPAWGGAGATTVVQELQFEPYEPETRSRKKLWIGLAVTGVVLVAGGALAAYLMVFSKLGGAATPEAAVTQLIEGAAQKDGVAMYGVLAPSEVSSLGDMMSPLADATDEQADPQAMLDLLDTLDIDLTGLKTSSETIGTGLAKVSIVGGTLTVDGDAKEITAALGKVYGPVMGTQGMSATDLDQMMDEAATELDKQLPWTVDAADLTWDTDRGTNRPFLVSVKEGDSWYVSPLMSVGEYVFTSGSADLVRGAVPTQDGKGAASPEEAGVAFTQALGQLFAGDAGPLAGVLPTAEARFAAVYGQAWLDELDEEDFEGVPTVEEAAFTSTSIGDGLARLKATKVVFGGDEPVTIEGTCATDPTGNKLCLADSKIGQQLGLDQLGLVSVKDDGGWRVSILATFGDMTRIVADKMAELKASGELDEGSLFSELMMGSAGFAGGPLEDSGLGDTSDEWPSPDSDLGGGYTFDEDGNLLDADGNIVDPSLGTAESGD
ncbi:variant leucine-rich repeat-containing protein [Cellulomonas edaphi]|uniref:Leucine rich repeat variant domain-containing protein n=1 Tax=Cellulomonas edaphi TaxID=3053468 RepID=A0ABT7S983_9CELL|nr:hypothetical protein [Cellulomons edaphi]MDM7832187.1 hypothetical protein [Cellulomons edaphi]